MEENIIKNLAENSLQQNVTSLHPLSGGDINWAYQIKTEKEAYFLKLNLSDKYPDMLKKEAYALQYISENSCFKTPRVLSFGIQQNYQYLFLEYIPSGKNTQETQALLGERLAKMHKQKQPYFGYIHDNYMGTVQQNNFQSSNWEDFFSQCRLIPLTKKLFDKGYFSREQVQQCDFLCKEIKNIYPKESPSLIHGDLWAGNYMTDLNSEPVLIDPSISYSHREMDIAMTLLFEGFSENFYTTYQTHYPLEKNWKQRIEISQLYPLLIHALLFKGHYINHCKSILEKYT